jgi:hypothetical protein
MSSITYIVEGFREAGPPRNLFFLLAATAGYPLGAVAASRRFGGLAALQTSCQ